MQIDRYLHLAVYSMNIWVLELGAAEIVANEWQKEGLGGCSKDFSAGTYQLAQSHSSILQIILELKQRAAEMMSNEHQMRGGLLRRLLEQWGHHLH